MNTTDPYRGQCIVLTTKHCKSIAVAPEFQEILGAAVIEYPADTDSLGTFSGEVERETTPLNCARRKCELGLDELDVDLGLASEGSFGPHPLMPFIPCGLEVVYFIDRRRDFHLHVARMSEQTNYGTEVIDSVDGLRQFAERALFPSHALVVRPNQWNPGDPIYKGVETAGDLERAFRRSQSQSGDGLVWVETDMRAHFNPTRMKEIGVLSRQLAMRLSTPCPACLSPGWGVVETVTGLLCEQCGEPTELMNHQVCKCVLCDYSERKERPDGLQKASPMHCGACNP